MISLLGLLGLLGLLASSCGTELGRGGHIVASPSSELPTYLPTSKVGSQAFICSMMYKVGTREVLLPPLPYCTCHHCKYSRHPCRLPT